MPEFFWIANHRGVDLLNTEVGGEHGDRVDLLRSPTDLLDWIDAAGLAPKQQPPRHGRDRRRAAHRDQGRIAAADLTLDVLLGWTRRLRAAARQVLDPAVRAPEDAVHELDALVGAVPVRLAHPAVATDPPLATRGDPYDELRLHLARAVLDALQLDRIYVRRCGGDRCILLFYDTSRTRSRRWCDMSVCGNRAKAAAHYHRHRRAPAP